MALKDKTEMREKQHPGDSYSLEILFKHTQKWLIQGGREGRGSQWSDQVVVSTTIGRLEKSSAEEA